MYVYILYEHNVNTFYYQFWKHSLDMKAHT